MVVVAVVALAVSSRSSDDDTASDGDDTASDDDDTASDDDDDTASGDDDSTDPPEPEYPGIGTDAAFANPNCDPETGRVRVPMLAAPACVVEWPAGADNGGDTSPGVSADAIVIVVRLDGSDGILDAATEGVREEYRDIVEIYNEHYELWGRRVQFEFIASSGGDEIAQRADADGGYRIVVSRQDPGVPNWLDTGGHRTGTMFWRFLLPEEDPPKPKCVVVPVGDLTP